MKKYTCQVVGTIVIQVEVMGDCENNAKEEAKKQFKKEQGYGWDRIEVIEVEEDF